MMIVMQVVMTAAISASIMLLYFPCRNDVSLHDVPLHDVAGATRGT